MHKTDAPFNENGSFVNPSTSNSTDGTVVDADWLNAVQNELVAIIQDTGVSLDKAKHDQVLTAIKKVVADNSSTIAIATKAQAETGSDNTTAMTPLRVAEALAVSLIGVPVGAIMPFVSEVSVPAGWLVCNGAGFDGSLYPKLQTAIGSTTLPDLRGEFIRGADLGRNVDVGRAVGSYQGHTIAKHRHLTVATPSGGITSLNSNNSIILQRNFSNSNSYVLNASGTSNYSPEPNVGRTSEAGGDETRPRNLAFIYAIKAE